MKRIRMGLPILLYHDIKLDDYDISSFTPGLRPYALRKSDFIAQMGWLYDNSYHTVSLKELGKNDDLSDKMVCLIFDDGWLSNYEIAYPLLNKYGFKATFFVIVGDIGKDDMMKWSQVKELSDNGMEIGSHSLSHRVPLELSDEELRYELKESKRILEENLGRKIEFFSMPTGFYDGRLPKFAKEVGYKAVCYSEVGLNSLHKCGQSTEEQSPFIQSTEGQSPFGDSPPESPFMRLKKIGIKRNYSIDTFKNIVEGRTNVLATLRLKQMIRNTAKSVLGARNYLRLRSFILKRAI